MNNEPKFARVALAAAFLAVSAPTAFAVPQPDTLKQQFVTPPQAAKPWVFWFVMDGNMTREGIHADFEAMKKAGIGGLVFMEVNIGVPRGPVDYMSPQWLDLIVYAVSEAKRLDLQITLATGPGWCGTGGPWNKVEDSMQMLVSSETGVTGPTHFTAELPEPRNGQQPGNFYRDEMVLAFPTPEGNERIASIDRKAFYSREGYDFDPRIAAVSASNSSEKAIPAQGVVNLTAKMDAAGRLDWQVPPGKWTVLRFGRVSTGHNSSPAPQPGVGLETDKLNLAALNKHLDNYTGKIFEKTGPNFRTPNGGITTIHFDSWEMGAQNWTPGLETEFRKRRGYDPTPYWPTLSGFVVGSAERSERFLWDFRQTVGELVVEKQGQGLRDYAHRHGIEFSSEAYDSVPGSNLDLAATTDVPFCEFWARGPITDKPVGGRWSRGYGPHLEWSCYEAVSAAHTGGKKIIGAEAFTGMPEEAWNTHPAVMKAQLDWALCAGINRFAIHRFQHQPDLNRFPGMSMGPYGMQWDRKQPWWDMTPAFNRYTARASQMLRQGVSVVDVLYLTPEGAPQVFTPPLTALTGGLPDRKSYNFDGCSPKTLLARAAVKNGRIVFPDGTAYSVLVLPEWPTMTPQLLRKISQLVTAGATVVGAPPIQSPSLSGQPASDVQVKTLAAQLWGKAPYAASRKVGLGRVIYARAAWDVPLDKARWIWFNEGNPAAAAPAGFRYFRAPLEIASGQKVKSALISLTADNSFEIFVNGHKIGDGTEHKQVFTFDLAPHLRSGSNEVRVHAFNSEGGGNPAGMIGAVKMTFADGKVQTLDTSANWSASQQESGPWSPALDLGPYTMKPWKFGEAPALYPSYLATVKILADLKIAPDFASTRPMRFIHRQMGGTDLYFVANSRTEPIETTATFRITGRQPEWWDAMTGQTRDLPNFTTANGVTKIPLRLEGDQSGFVVFRHPAKKPTSNATNFPTFRPYKTLTAPWHVAFDPKWGGPAEITFSKLDDWSQRPEPGLKNYSGQAKYTTSFDLPGATTAGSKYRLSLGQVQVAAKIRLNGRDLGALWCAPWSLDVPAGVLKPTGNQLEVTVANLWINRLIGDAGKPQEQRLTSTNYNPFQPGTPLRSSGLLGPVRVERRVH